MTQLSITTDHQAEATVVALAGELDLGSRTRLQAALAEAIEAGRPVVVDLSGLTFMDSTGIAVLTNARRAAGEAGVPLTVTEATGTVERILEMTGVRQFLSGEWPQR
ncbi:STAS domain-containing protein [Hamadaea tsunoensis]|uniref:STAS domain-containing protein n=1 Tax=Hamadaea tsunoensis TaxID=53368 RepID=UPI0004264233|nr:STAS domain-containing protein [Hamadaea tsunoensis]